MGGEENTEGSIQRIREMGVQIVCRKRKQLHKFRVIVQCRLDMDKLDRNKPGREEVKGEIRDDKQPIPTICTTSFSNKL